RYFLEAHAADQRKPRRDLETVFERRGECVEAASPCYQLDVTVVAAHRIDHRDAVLREPAEVLLEENVVVLRRELGGETVLHPEYLRDQTQVRDLTDDLLVVRNEEAIAVDQLCIGVECIGLAVEPTPVGLIHIHLISKGHAVDGRPLKAASQPELR